MHHFELELQQAEAARQAGNEGKARVCARRAAGIVIRTYLARRSESEADLQLPRTPSAYDQIRYFEALPDVPPGVKEIASHFLVPVDYDHKLPIEADLIAEARWLARQLLG